MMRRPAVGLVQLSTLALMGLALTAFYYMHESRDLHDQIVAAAMDRATALGNRVAGRYEHFLARGDRTEATLVIEALGGTPDLAWGVAADASGLIRDATDRRLVGRSLALVLGNPAIADSVQSPLAAGTFDVGDSTLTAIYAWWPPPRAGELRASRPGTIGLRFELARSLRVARWAVRQRVQYAAVIILVACLVGWIGNYFLVGRHVLRLAEATRRLAGGDLTARVVPGGPAEVALLGEQFNAMVTHLDDSTRDLRRANRALRTLSRCNEELVRAHDAASLLEAICRVAVNDGGYATAWVGLAEAAPGCRVRPVAYAGGDDAFVRALDCTWGPEPEGKGPVGTAIQTGAPVAVGDLDADPSPLPWRLAARARGVRSALALPLRVNGTVIGGLAVYAAEPGAFGPGQQALLAELAEDLGFGLQVLQERTEREAAGRALQDSTSRLQLALEMAQLGYWEFDFATGRFAYDRHLMAIYRRPAGDDSPSALSLEELADQFLPPEDAATIRREIAAAHTLAPGETRQFEHGFRRHDGTEGFMSVRFAVTRDDAGQPRTAYGLSQDVTERRAAELAAEQYRRRATAIIDSSLDGIVSVDADQRIVVFNPAAERIFHCSASEAIGRPFDRFVPEDLRTRHQDLFNAFAADPGARQAMGAFRPVQAVRADGEPVLLEAAIFKGEVDGQRLFTVACRDVSERHTAERHRHELEAQLRQAQKMEAIGLLAGGVAHDFNNILGAIMMQVSLAQSEPALPPGALEGLEDIKHSADRAANLTRQLLLFSRKQAMQPKTLDLAELVSSIAKMLQRVLREDIRLQVKHQGGPLPVEGDPGMLDQVLLNLAVNARDAMPDGGSLIITTGLRHLDAAAAGAAQLPPGPYAVIEVTDSGSGIPPEVLPHIFEPFFTTKAAGQGTGLGLATVFGIVQQHRGTIHVRSTPGQGTSFELLLPCVVPDAAVAGSGTSRALERPATETVLLVEDEPAVRRLTSRVLERRGYRVLTAAHGREALRLWQEAQGKVQVLVTDIVMPGGLTGQELATRLQGEAPGLKVILMSGYAVDAGGRPLQIPEGQVFMQKPISPRELLETVARALEG